MCHKNRPTNQNNFDEESLHDVSTQALESDTIVALLRSLLDLYITETY